MAPRWYGKGENNSISLSRFKALGHLRKIRALAILFIFLALLLLGYNYLTGPPPSSLHKDDIKVTVNPNVTTAEIGRLLQQEGVIKSFRLFSIYTRVTGLDSSLKAGEYTFPAGLYLNEVVDRMVVGALVLSTFTIPEGYTLAQISDYLDRQGIVSGEEFDLAVTSGEFDYNFVGGLPVRENRLEGYLFPDTYTIRKDTDAEEIIDIMLQRFDEKLGEMNYLARLESKGLSLHAAVTIAAMVEREAQVESERPLIAGVIFNRLARGMPLQIDATVLYALGSHKPVVLYKDLEIDSPYNTYRNIGLPPGPIAAPGEACLLAVVEPASTDYLYYCARPDGSHAFARTLAEHEANVKKYINN